MTDKILDMIDKLYKDGEEKVRQVLAEREEGHVNLITFEPTRSILGDPVEWDIRLTGNGHFVGVLEHYLTRDGYPYVFTDCFGTMHTEESLGDINTLMYDLVNPEIEQLN